MPERKRTDVLGTFHGQTLEKMVKNYRGKTIDLGCGASEVSVMFNDYTGVDLPDFNVYETDLKFIEEYDIVLMNAFIDVMQFPLYVLAKVLKHCKKYVILHRQEFTHGPTGITQEPAYGGWTYHSHINNWDFKVLTRDFKIKRKEKLNFDNWEDGGYSILMKRI